MFASDRNAMASPIRFPSTANLAIDSYDRGGNSKVDTPGSSAANFTITKDGNIMSGFFTRVAVTEVVLDWAIPNISALKGDNTFSILTGSTVTTLVIPDGNYTVATLMNYIVVTLNAAALGITFSLTGSDGKKSLSATGAFTVQSTILSGFLSMTPANVAVPSVGNAVAFPYPELLPIAYVDITCGSLTYQQGLKDADTSATSRDVLYRWVFAWDDYNPLDSLGYPIYQGYMPFKSRRALNFPKQIKWDGQQPLGQLIFQVYGSDGELAKTTQSGVFEWQMNLLVSEQ